MTTYQITPEAIRAWVQFILIIFAAAWGVYEFIYKERIVPAKRPAALSITSSIEEVGRKGNMALLRARVHAANRSNAKVYVPAFWFTAKGLVISAYDRSAEEYAAEVSNALEESDGEESKIFPRYSKEKSDVVATWRFLQFDTFYEPGDETTNEELFYVPLNRYDAVELKGQVFLTKGIKMFAPTEWSVAEDGSLNPRPMVKRPGYENNAALVEAWDGARDPRHIKWQKKYGVCWNWSVATLPLGNTELRQI